MEHKERLINLIIESVNGCARNWAEVIANHLIENGIIVPPCKVGDVVYQTDGVRIYESTVTKVIYETTGIDFDESAIGNTVFLSEEEARKGVRNGTKRKID